MSNLPPTSNEIQELVMKVSNQQGGVVDFIVRTPTSKKRNHLTEANIHLCLALEALYQARDA